MFFKPISVEFFRLFLKPFLHHMWRNSFEMCLESCKQPKSDGAKSRLLGRCGTTSNLTLSIATEVATLVCGVALSCWRNISFFPWQTWLICFFQLLYSFHVSLRADFHPFYSINLSHFCLFKMWVAVTGLPECGWSLRFKFLPLSLMFITQWWTVLMLTVPSPQKANNHWWILVGVIFLCVKKSVTACCLVCITKVKNETWILNQPQHKPLGYQAVPHCKVKPTEHWTSWYKYCFKVTPLVWYLHGGTTFWTS